jgi:Fe-Mn family superoxide dismutase
MTYSVTPLAFKPSRLDGLSAKLLTSHYVNNYGGAVRRLNAIEARLSALDFGAEPGFVVNGLAREALIAQNSMILHEVHFDGLGGSGPPSGPLAGAIDHDFGSLERWQKRITAMGKALAGGSGWVILAWSPRAGRLVNQWAADHTHVLAGSTPILALDMYEHAYHLDFGADAGRYVDTVMRNLHWRRLGIRYEAARAGSTAPAIAGGVPAERVLADRESVLLVDVRLPDDYAASGIRMPGGRLVRPGAGRGLGQAPVAQPQGRRLLRLWLRGQHQGRRSAVPAGPRRRDPGRRARLLARRRRTGRAQHVKGTSR